MSPAETTPDETPQNQVNSISPADEADGAMSIADDRSSDTAPEVHETQDSPAVQGFEHLPADEQALAAELHGSIAEVADEALRGMDAATSLKAKLNGGVDEAGEEHEGFNFGRETDEMADISRQIDVVLNRVEEFEDTPIGLIAGRIHRPIISGRYWDAVEERNNLVETVYTREDALLGDMAFLRSEVERVRFNMSLNLPSGVLNDLDVLLVKLEASRQEIVSSNERFKRGWMDTTPGFAKLAVIRQGKGQDFNGNPLDNAKPEAVTGIGGAADEQGSTDDSNANPSGVQSIG